MFQSKWLKITGHLFRYSFDLILPKNCVLCGLSLPMGAGRNICFRCRKGLLFVEAIICRKCGLPSPVVGKRGVPRPTSQCRWCRRWKFEFDMARAIGLYQGNLKELIHKFKYNRMVNLAGDILELMTQNFPEDYRDVAFDYLIPVPLHLKKLKEREYNQTAILAEKMSGFLNVPVAANILLRERYTPPQVSLSGEERRKNVRNAFQIKGYGPLENKNLLLLDDVFTTGATINECARTLRKAKPRGINVLTIARALQ